MHKRGVDGFRVLQSEEKEKYQTIMLQITLDMYQTLAAAVVVLALGRFLRGRVRLLERFCIPAPVIGGVLFAIFTCVCYGTGIAEFAFDDLLKEVCMVFFFTSVGFQANLKVLRSGGTAMIGDPSGKTDMRKMMTVETIDHNGECIKQQMSRFLDFSDDKAIIVNNADWLRNLNFIEFMRDIGAMFSVNKMLTADCYKTRMATDNGLSFLEFTYMLMQSYDFLELFHRYGCRLEMGGNDQWSNMLGGADLVRRKDSEKAFACTFQLLLTHDGKKMGKTQKGALWLRAEKTSPYEFFQYWRNVADADVIKCLKMLTFLPLEEIVAMESWEGSQLNKAKEILAFELTMLVHGEEEAQKAKEASAALFAGNGNHENMPTTALADEDFADGNIDIMSILVKTGMTASRSEARRAVEQGGVTVNGEKVTDIKTTYEKSVFADEFVIKKGKKSFQKITLA